MTAGTQRPAMPSAMPPTLPPTLPPTPRPAVPGAPAAATRALWPGLAVTALAVAFALLVNRYVPALSPAVVAVASGAALANLAGVRERLLPGPAGGGRRTGVRERLQPGLAFVSRRVLRVAIALLGLQIALPQVLALGWQTLAVVTVATGLTFSVTPAIGRRLGVGPGASLLVATGVSICGAAAIAAMRESTDLPDEDDAAGALGVVVLYGTGAIALVPLLASLMHLSPAQLGVWTGAAVHEVAQVAAIGAASGVLAGAVTVKLARVLLLAPLVALMSHRHRHRPARGARPPVVPLFVAAFLVMVAVRGTGLVPAVVTDAVPVITNVLMAAALFGLGTGIDVRKLAKGGRVVLLGGIATAIIAATSLAGVALLV
ncbi:putative sulfate exporter family transporter [Nonomuraea sp. NPDC049709]|uniref:YeiH family protein n=1 Tax=Nonomuraea sp. NPDC049709 TaxID=3154736 RepID=UPI00341CF30D